MPSRTVGLMWMQLRFREQISTEGSLNDQKDHSLWYVSPIVFTSLTAIRQQGWWDDEQSCSTNGYSVQVNIAKRDTNFYFSIFKWFLVPIY